MKSYEIEQLRTRHHNCYGENEYYNCVIIKFTRNVNISRDEIKFVNQSIEYSHNVDVSKDNSQDFFLFYGNLNNFETIFEPKIEIMPKWYIEKDVLDCCNVIETHRVLNIKLERYKNCCVTLGCRF